MQMDQDLTNVTCYKHINQKILVVDLSKSKSGERRYLCLQCLIELLENQNLTETLLIKKEQKIQNKQQKINFFKDIQQNLCKFKEVIDQLLEMNIKSLINKTQELQSQLEEIESQEMVINLNSDLNILSENYKGSYDYDIPQENEKNDKENEFIDSIISQLSGVTKNQILLQTLKELDKIKSFEMPSVKKSLIKQQETYKTPSLRFNYNLHGKEIIMFNFSQTQEIINRLACIDCVQQQPNNYLTLEQANLKWSELKCKQGDLTDQLAESRISKKNNFIKQLEKNCNEYLDNATKIIKSFQEQTQHFENKVIHQTNNQNLNQMDEKCLRDIIQILSQNNNLKAQIQQKLKQEQYDQRYYDDTIKQFQKLISYNRANVQNILFLNNQLDQQIQQEQKNLIQNQNNPQYDYLEIINKLDQFQLDIKVFQSTMEQYQIIDREAEQMKLNLRVQLNEQPDSQLQKKFDFFDSQYLYFQQNTKMFKKFLQIEEIEQSKQIVEQKFKELDDKMKEHILLFQNLQQQKLELDKDLENRDIEIQQFSKKLIKQLEQLQKQNLADIDKQQKEFENLVQVNQENVKQKQILEQDFQNKNIVVGQLNQQKQENEAKINRLNNELITKEQLINNQKNQIQQLQQNPEYNAFLQYNNQTNEMKQYLRKLEFSLFNKHRHLLVLEDQKKQIKNATSNRGWYFGLCDQRIPNQGVTKVCFKVSGQEKEAFILGIGQKNRIQEFQFYDCNKEGRGTQVLVNYEGCYFDYTGCKKDAFKFWPNDVIMIEVDRNNNFIRWTKKDTQDGFAIKIKLEGDLYFCVGLWYQNQSVRILDDFF